MPLTKRQELLIKGLRDRNLLVSAAAGSGKTMVLVERILHHITVYEVDIHRLLVVTFTKKAAAEMKQRIQEALEERLIERGEKGPFLRRQLHLLNRASIKTLHSFCLDIIRENFHLLDIDPAFRMAEATEIELLSKEALEEYFEASYQREERGFLRLLESYGTKWGDERLREMILSIHQFIQSHPQPFLWLDKALHLYDVEQEELHNHIWVKTILEWISSVLKSCSIFLERACELCREPRAPHEYLKTLEKDLESQEELFSLLEEGLDTFLEGLKGRGFPRLASLRGPRREEVDKNLLNQIQELRRLYKKEREKIGDAIKWDSIEEALGHLKDLYLEMESLSSAVEEFHQIYAKKKLMRGLLDYNDLEHMALRVLEEEDVKRALKEKYTYIFMDEYQDSNPVQESIIEEIKREDNLFMVGDVRQSIYRFRLADPTIFLEKYRTFTKYQEDAPTTALNLRVDLQKNFRSREEVIGAVNLLFKHLMTPTLGEMEYNEDAYLYRGLDWDVKRNASPELIIIEEEDREVQEELDEEIKEMTRTQVEAQVIGERIKEILNQEIHLPKEERPRPIQYKDIVILLRSPSRRGQVYEEVFDQEGIPLQVERGSDFFSSYEVQVFLNLLRVLDNGRQDLPLLSLLYSPVGGFTIEELTSIRLASPDGSYFTALERYAKRDDPLAERVNLFLERIKDWRVESRCYKVSDFIWHLLLESGLYHHAGIKPRGERRQAHLLTLVEKAMALEKEWGSHIFLFLSFLDRLSQEPEASAPPPVHGEEEAVHLMSVHKSKGLEFPIVIMGDLGCRFNLRDSQGQLLLHQDLGIGLKHIDVERRTSTDSLAQLAIRERRKREILSEELRILYVALTRAIHSLLLVGSVKDLSSSSQRWLLGTDPSQLLNGPSFLDWIGRVLVKYKGGEPIREVAGVSKEVEKETPPWRVSILSKGDLASQELERREGRKEDLFPLPTISKEVEEPLGWSYPYQEAVHLPSKVSVTEILDEWEKSKREEKREDQDPSLPPSVDREAQKRGILMHTIMRYLPLHEVFDLNQEIESLVQEGLVKEEEVPLIHREGIEDFLKSSLWSRMLRSPRVSREVPFVLKKRASHILPNREESREEITIQGIMDALFLEDGEAVLVDYKTDWVGQRAVKRQRERYRLQMYLYREAAEACGLKVKETYLYFFSYGAVRIE